MKATVLTVELVVNGGWAVGNVAEPLAAVDRGLLRDQCGDPWIPAAALAGSLRAHLAVSGLDEELMGSRPPAVGVDHADALLPSPMAVLGAHIQPPAKGKHEVSVVGQTAVDPHRAAARPQALRTSEQVESEVVVHVFLQYDGELDEEGVGAIKAWRPSVGRDRTKGAGQARVTRLARRVYDLADEDDLTAWLASPGRDRFTVADNQWWVAHEQLSVPVVDVDFDVLTRLHIGVGRTKDDNGRRVAQLRWCQGGPLVSGSTWKGVFRSRARFILRSLGEPACGNVDGCGEQICRLCAVFGSTSRRGSLAFLDSRVLGSTLETRTHVAIDRFTAGSRDKLLFTHQECRGGTVRLRVEELEPVEAWVPVLLHHVVRDIDDGLIGLGAETTRGLGTLRLTEASRRGFGEPTSLVAALRSLAK